MGQIFGVKSFFTGERREHTMRSLNFSTVFEIKQSDFLAIIRKSTVDYEKFALMRDQIKLYSQYQKVKMSCLCCKKQDHIITDCSILHYTPDKDFLIKRLLYSKNQMRKEYPRRKLKGYNARSNIRYLQSAATSLSSDFFSEYSERSNASIEENIDEGDTKAIAEPIKLQKLDSSISIPSGVKQVPSINRLPSPFIEQNMISEFEPNENRERNISLLMLREVESKEFIAIKPSEKKNSEIQMTQSSNKKKVNTKEQINLIDKKRVSEKTKEKSFAVNELNMFDYDFERMMDYKYYFHENNVGKLFSQKRKTRQHSPKLRTSRKFSQTKKRDEMLSTAKFIVIPNPNEEHHASLKILPKINVD